MSTSCSNVVRSFLASENRKDEKPEFKGIVHAKIKMMSSITHCSNYIDYFYDTCTC